MDRIRLQKAKRIVVKVGSSVLTSRNYTLDTVWIGGFVKQVSAVLKQGIEVAIVSSGAIASGMGLLGMKKRPKSLPEQQACAALGQVRLMDVYEEAFKKKGFHAGQILLTWEDIRDRSRYLNAENTLHTLLNRKVVPIINENDTVSVDEIRFGDNDTLSALVATMIGAELLVILTDVEGLYLKDKKACVDVVNEIDSIIEKSASGTDKECSLGGMKTKLSASKIAVSSGIDCVIANGRAKDVLIQIIKGEKIGTLFVANKDKMKGRKRWIAYNAKTQGKVFVDDGAKEALVGKNSSLLPCGVKKIEGKFLYGDVISVADMNGNIFAKGLSNYSAGDLERIKGLNTREVEKIIKEDFYQEVVHRDNLVLL